MVKITMYIGGLIFGFGLALAGATQPEIVLSFLRFEDFGLLLVILVALLITFMVYQGVPRLLKEPPFGEGFDGHDGFPVTRRTIVGAVLFGVGWGLAGICPATSLAALGTGNWPLWYAIAGMLLGTLMYGSLRSSRPDNHL